MKIKHSIPNLNRLKILTKLQILRNNNSNKIARNQVKKYSKFHLQKAILNLMKSKDPLT